MSEGDKTQKGFMEATPTSPSTNAATRAAAQKKQMEGEQAEETESGTTDEVIDLEVLGEAVPEQAAGSLNETKVTELAGATSQSLQQTPALPPPAGATAEIEKTGTKRPASIASCRKKMSVGISPTMQRQERAKVLGAKGVTSVAALLHPLHVLAPPNSR